MQKPKWFIFILLTFLLGCAKGQNGNSNGNNNPPGDRDPEESLIGKVLPDWSEGYLDIHAINTGRGECTLLIFPDGTTLMIDAASSLISVTDPIPPPAQKPNSTVPPGLVITNYAKHFIRSASNKLNYIMLSHFDPDHMGGYDTNLPMDPTGTFRMGGVTEVGAKIAFDKIIDRGYPDYNFPTNMTSNTRMANYIKFINWAKTNRGATAEQFSAGRNDQILMTQNPSKYSNFEIRNICGNGVVWTGTGSAAVNTLPPAGEVASANAAENIFSLGLLLSYGKFNYFTAGDLQYNDRTSYAWKDIEARVATVVPVVDVMKADHHGTSNCNSTALLSSLSPQTVLIHPWRDVHPNPETIGRMFTANNNCQIFCTNMTEPNKPRLGTYLNRLKAIQGHLVVRVKPGGDEYYVYILNDNDQEYKVKDVFGPYKCK